MQAVVPQALWNAYGSAGGSPRSYAYPGWRRRVRVGSGLAVGCAIILLCLSVSSRPDSLEAVVSPPVMGTGGGPTTPAAVQASVVSKAVMGTACKNCEHLDGPIVHGAGSWQNYAVDYNVFGLNVDKGSNDDADTPGALPDDGRNEWENSFAGFDFKPSDRHDGSLTATILLCLV